MPYEKLPDTKQPTIDRSATIWRYMDLPKLASMLSRNGLYFCQAPLLGDPYEGSLLPSVIQSVKDIQPHINKEYPEFARTPQQHTNNIMATRAYTYASCWHQNEYESAAMWAQYAKDGFGIAVRSTMGRLVDSFGNVVEKVWIGQINYHDYQKDSPPRNDLWMPMYQKRKSFEHEREIRAVVMDFDRMTELRGAWQYEPNPVAGRLVGSDLRILIEKFYLSPDAPEWFADAIRSVIAALGFDGIAVEQSDMGGSPNFSFL